MAKENNSKEIQYSDKLNKKQTKKSKQIIEESIEETKIDYPTQLRKSIGSKVRLKRNLLGLTQVQLSELICANHPARIFPSSKNKNDDGTPEILIKHAISNQDISNVENGSNNYGIVQLELLSEALNITAFDFFDSTTVTTKQSVKENLNKDSHEVVDSISNILNEHLNNGTLLPSDLEHILSTINFLATKNSSTSVDNSTSEKFYD